MSIEKEVLYRFSQCKHLMQTNVEIEDYELDEKDEDEDFDNPGFVKGWHYYLDILSNSVISFPSQELREIENDEFRIEIRISDNIIIKMTKENLIEEFLEQCEKKSRFFENIANMNPENKISKKLGL